MSSVGLRAFLRQLMVCSEKAACIGRQIRSMQTDFHGFIQEKQLDENHQHLAADYKTFADVIIQESIKRDLGNLYPMLAQRIYGEEDGSVKLQSNEDKIVIDLNKNSGEILILLKKVFERQSSESMMALANLLDSSSSIHLKSEDEKSLEQIPLSYEIDLSKIAIWIDPIDGTQQYINGNDASIEKTTGIICDGLPTAMVLIGCFDIENGQAKIGVINRAFDKKLDDNHWTGAIYWGTHFSDAKFHYLQNQQTQKRQRVLVYGSVNSNTFGHMFDDWSKFEVAACGNKLLSIVLKQANVFFVTKSVAYNWDLCAADAILQSIDGHIVDLRQILRIYREQSNIDEIDLTKFSISYYKNSSESSTSKDFACPPFIAFYDRQDLCDCLKILANHNIHIE